MEKAKKSFRGGDRKPFHKGKNAGDHEKKPFKRRKLEPGVEFEDRTLGVGIVRKVMEEGIVVAFGDVEKVIPRRKREKTDRNDRMDKSSRAFGKPLEKRVFTFDTKPGQTERPAPERKGQKKEVEVGLEVTDEILGKGTVSRITERGVYVTYEATGEHIMYPTGLPAKLLRSAFPMRKKEKKEEMPKGEGRTYKVPETVRPAPKKAVAPHTARETHRGNTRYIDLGEGTLVVSPLYGEGVIRDIENGHMTVEFKEVTKDFTYPRAFAEGDIEVVEKEEKGM